jgi:hypothetical protein
VLQQYEANNPKRRQQLNDDNQSFQNQHHTHLSLYLIAWHNAHHAQWGLPRPRNLLIA